MEEFWQGASHSPLDEYATHVDIAARRELGLTPAEIERRADATFEAWQRTGTPPGA